MSKDVPKAAEVFDLYGDSQHPSKEIDKIPDEVCRDRQLWQFLCSDLKSVRVRQLKKQLRDFESDFSISSSKDLETVGLSGFIDVEYDDPEPNETGRGLENVQGYSLSIDIPVKPVTGPSAMNDYLTRYRVQVKANFRGANLFEIRSYGDSDDLSESWEEATKRVEILIKNYFHPLPNKMKSFHKSMSRRLSNVHFCSEHEYLQQVKRLFDRRAQLKEW
jgi:hypothetical protein